MVWVSCNCFTLKVKARMYTRCTDLKQMSVYDTIPGLCYVHIHVQFHIPFLADGFVVVAFLAVRLSAFWVELGCNDGIRPFIFATCIIKGSPLSCLIVVCQLLHLFNRPYNYYNSNIEAPGCAFLLTGEYM